MPEKKSNHQVKIVRIKELLPHTNADTLELVHVGGYQVVIKKGDFKVGDLAVYIQPDSVVPQTEPFRFIWEKYVELDGTVREKRRRITVRKFRKEWSEGLLMPIQAFKEELQHIDWNEGTDVSDLLGITHYDPDAGKEDTYGVNINAPRRRYPRSLKGWVRFLYHKLLGHKSSRQLTEEMALEIPVYDVEAYKNYVDAFIPGEMVVVTEKIHGSNARFVFYDGKMYAGSRKLWKAENSDCVWRKVLAQRPEIERWCRAHEGEVLYGEVVPTQGEPFTYGCKDGEVRFLAFDIYGNTGWRKPFTIEMPLHDTVIVSQDGVPVVPPLYYGPFDIEKIKSFVDGPSMVLGAKNIREGIVVTPVNERHVIGLGRLQLKLVSNAFLEKS